MKSALNNIFRGIIPLILAACFILLSSSKCTTIQEPEFIKLKDWDISRAQGGYLQIKTKAELFNPNNVGVKLSNVYVELYLEDKKLAVVNQTTEIKVPRKDHFEVPLALTVKLEDKGSLLLNSFRKFLSKEGTNLDCKGFIEIRKFGIPIKVDIRDKYPLKLTDLDILK